MREDYSIKELNPRKKSICIHSLSGIEWYYLSERVPQDCEHGQRNR